MDTDTSESSDSTVVATLLISDTIQSKDSAPNLRRPASEVLERGETLQTGEKNKIIDLRVGETLRIGRSKSNDYPISNRNVSRFHSVFSASATGVVLSDLSSLNGTLVNGVRISTPVDLSSGDVVTIGDTLIAVKIKLGDQGDSDSMLGRTQTAQLASVVVTVLVVDVCGYTKLSEALPPKDVAEMMHLWFQKVSAVVNQHGGTVDKYIGDCVMALWRSKASGAGDHAVSAVHAGCDIQKATADMSGSGLWAHNESFPWTCRVALNTGEALMGTVGGAGKRDFTVLGDTVNVAFRLEGVAGDLQTNFIMSASTAEHVEDSIELSSLGVVSVSGRKGEVSVFTLA